MRLNKNIKIFTNYFLGPLLFGWLCFSIYNQVHNQSQVATVWLHIQQSFSTEKGFYLILALGLMIMNWGLETVKWQVAVAPVHPLRFLQAFKAVLSGVSFSVTTPNRVGEYVGRMLYMPEGKRLKVIAVSLASSMSQLLITLILGTAAFIILKSALVKTWPDLHVWHYYIATSAVLLIVILSCLFFNLSRLEKQMERWFSKSKYLYLIQALKDFGVQRLSTLLLLSFARFCVFVAQYILLFRLFEVSVPIATLFWVMCLVFLALAVIPSITLVEIGVRGEVSLLLVGLFTTNSLGIILTSVAIWLINLIIPALAGSILMLGVKAFKKRKEKQANQKKQVLEVL